MAEDFETVFRDATPLYAAAKALLGYWLNAEYREYLGFVLSNIRRWSEAGLFLAPGKPTPAFQHCPFDFQAINPDALAIFCGSYFFVQASHKKANYRLLHDETKKRVLYLRGYDYEASVGAGAGTGVAAGLATADTTRFNGILGPLLAPEFEVFKVLSSRDFRIETTGLDKYYYGDYGGIIRASSAPIRSLYLNAQHWQEGVVELADRVDFFVAYVSSITPSALWELKWLKDKGFADRTLVVFDEKAIRTKNLHASFYEDIPGLKLGEPLWLPSKKRTTEQDIAALRAELETSFAVESAEGFEARANALRARIRNASGPPDRRKAAIDFRFYPALDDAALDDLRRLDAALWREVDPEGPREIECLPFRVNQILLRVYTSLLFGEHYQAGLSLAVYAGILDAAVEFYTSAGEPPENVASLGDHRDLAADIAWNFLCAGTSDEFGDYTKPGKIVHDRLFASSKERALEFLRGLQQP